MNHNYEFNFVTTSRKVSSQIQGMIETDITRSKEIQPGDVTFGGKILGKLLNLPFISYFL